MPAVIPVVASFAAASSAVAAAGSLAAAMGTFTGFMSVAGAALTGIGALTGKKDLTKIGGFMSLAGGIGQAFGGAAGASNAAQEAFRASELGATGATNAAAESAGAFSSMQGIGPEASGAWYDAASPIADTALGDTSKAVAGGLGDSTYVGATRAAAGATPTPTAEPSMLSRIGSTVRQNKELFQLGGGMLNSMFGPEAEMLELRKREAERRRRNLNSPVRMGMLPGYGS